MKVRNEKYKKATPVRSFINQQKEILMIHYFSHRIGASTNRSCFNEYGRYSTSLVLIGRHVYKWMHGRKLPEYSQVTESCLCSQECTVWSDMEDKLKKYCAGQWGSTLLGREETKWKQTYLVPKKTLWFPAYSVTSLFLLYAVDK